MNFEEETISVRMDHAKAAANLIKHDVPFDLARTIFSNSVALGFLSLARVRSDAYENSHYLGTQFNAARNPSI